MQWHTRLPTVFSIALLAIVSTFATAQEPQQPAPSAPSPQREEPRPDELEPAVNTSAPVATGKDAVPAATQTSPAPVPAAAPKADAPAKTSGGAAPAAGKGRVLDRLELDTTQITGNRELPKVLYIVPWKRSDLGDLLGKPVNSLLDEVLQPVDRDVFRRENRYYRALQPETSPVPAPAPPE